jgi:hypothetical protein
MEAVSRKKTEAGLESVVIPARLVATGPWPPYHFVEWEPRS